MKLSCAWFGFSEMTAINYFEAAAALGLRSVEIPLYWQLVKDRHCGYDYRRSDQVARLAADAAEAGVRLVAGVTNTALASRGAHPPGTISTSEIEFGSAVARRAIDVASELGLEIVRVTEPSLTKDEASEWESVIEMWAPPLRDLADYARDRPVRLAVENYGLTGEQLSHLLTVVDRPEKVGALFDPCNFVRMGEDPIAALSLLGERVFYCHAKDTAQGESREKARLFRESRWQPSVAVGDGQIDWSTLLRELDHSFDGFIAIEYEMAADVMRGTRRSIKALRDAATDASLELW